MAEIHVDVCPDCNTPAHAHSMDPPPIPPPECRHERERFVPVRFVDAEELIARLEAQRDEARKDARLWGQGLRGREQRGRASGLTTAIEALRGGKHG